MTAQAVVGPAGYTGASLTGLTANIVQYIDSGMVDQALRVIFDAVVDRKKTLDATGNMPHQITRQDIDSALTYVNPDPAMFPSTGDVLVADGNGGQQWQGNSPISTPATITLDSPKPKAVRRRKVEPRPDPSVAPFTGIVMPLTRQDQSARDASKMIPLNGYVYDKGDIVGKYIHVSFPNHPGLTFKITGVGPKTLKALVVHEPNKGDRLQGKDVWKAWDTNTPMFLPHSAIAHWLGRPTDNSNY